MNLNIDNLIGVSQGVSLTFLSLSGLKCINSKKCSRNCSSETESEGSINNCSKTNMNLGLATLGLSGVLMIYKNMRY